LIQLRSDSTSVPERITFSDFWPHANRPFRILGIGLELARNGGSCIWKVSPARGISLSCKLGPIQCREYENSLLEWEHKKNRQSRGWLGRAKMRLMHEVGKYKMNSNENSYLYRHVFATDRRISRQCELHASGCFTNKKIEWLPL